jgi:hypothetical protein
MARTIMVLTQQPFLPRMKLVKDNAESQAGGKHQPTV